DALGLKSKSRVSALLDRLEERGFITREKCRRQSLCLVPQSDDRVKGALDAARALLDAIVHEDPDNGIATVRSEALGALDVALAELAA
ncbi:MAG: hypothetical protein LDL39_13840, partial [Magnetospirillum sp.]|nr:hypothetical protein [Magnetospirillum sp.]